ncbi:MAG: PIN domain-containing protein [Pseudonocardiaceae bacterium]
MSAPRRVVLDASALLAWALNERGADTIGKLLPVAVIPAPNLVEVLYLAPERGHRMTVGQIQEHALAMGPTVEPFTASDVARAAELIAYSRASRRDAQGDCLSLGDGLGLAIAARLELPITGGDQLWAALPLSVQFMPFRR